MLLASFWRHGMHGARACCCLLCAGDLCCVLAFGGCLASSQYIHAAVKDYAPRITCHLHSQDSAGRSRLPWVDSWVNGICSSKDEWPCAVLPRITKPPGYLLNAKDGIRHSRICTGHDG